jgi:hypothetical protein
MARRTEIGLKEWSDGSFDLLGMFRFQVTTWKSS